MKTAYSGEVIWSGEKYIVSPETCYGYSDKNWGKDFTSPWVWLSSNNLTSKITGKKLTDITCEKKDMLLVNYEAPNGKKLHNRLWNGGNGKGIVKLYRGKKLIDEVICENVGCEYGEYDSVD
ncbi:MAG: tocopherol cyclase family protein [Agathobacter sp.]|nr:tocopherol cyclase family protein [Agathobacter sp.]